MSAKLSKGRSNKKRSDLVHNINSSSSLEVANSESIDYFTDKHNVGFHFAIKKDSAVYQQLIKEGKAIPNFHCKLYQFQCKAKVEKTQARCTNSATETIPYCKKHLPIYMHLETKESSIAMAGKGLYAKLPEKLVRQIEKAHLVEPGEKIVVFYRGDLIARYIGEYITENELTRRYGDFVAPYAISNNALKYLYEKEERDTDKMNRELKYFIDAACVRSIASYANDSSNEEDINANFREYTHHGKEILLLQPNFKKDNEHHNNIFTSDQLGTGKGQLHPRHVNIGLFATRDIYDGDEIFVSYGDDYWNEADKAVEQRRLSNYSSSSLFSSKK